MACASSERLDDRVCELAGGELGEAADRRAAMMRPSGEDLKIYLHRAPIDMRKGRNGLAALAQEVIKWILSYVASLNMCRPTTSRQPVH